MSLRNKGGKFWVTVVVCTGIFFWNLNRAIQNRMGRNLYQYTRELLFADSELESRIVGSWSQDTAVPGGNARLRQRYTFHSDRTWNGFVAVVSSDPSKRGMISVSGTWRVVDYSIVCVVTRTDSPDMIPVGES